MTGICPRCRAPALLAGMRWLEPQPHPFGIWRPDGAGKWPSFDLRLAARQHKAIGHRQHECATPPQPQDQQLALDI